MSDPAVQHDAEETDTEEAPPPELAGAADAVAAGALPPPAWLRSLADYETVVRLGRAWPAATRLERGFWAALLVACLTVLGVARALDPDPRGIGTHEQLGLPPCGFVEQLDGIPCPSCGYTTTFAHAADGDVAAALSNQPFGFVVFVLTVAAVPITAFAVFGRVSLFACTERWPMLKLFGALAALWLAAWLYKWHLLAG